MIALDVSVDDQSGIAGAISGLRSQLPYVAALGINDTINQVQAAIQKTLPAAFTLRRESFIKDTIYIAPSDRATKDNLVGTVRVNPDRNFLAKFEDGGSKQSIVGKALAVPIMRLDDPSMIVGRGDPLSVQRLMASIQTGGGRLLTPRVRKGVLRVKVDPNKVFLVKTANGTFILQRTGPNTTRVLYAFKKQVPIAPVLNFDEIALATATDRWQPNFERALEYAIATMR